jgi:hypothetical protein
VVPRAQLISQGLQPFHTACGKYEIMSACGKVACKGGADAGGRASDQGERAGRSHKVVSLWFCRFLPSQQ